MDLERRFIIAIRVTAIGATRNDFGRGAYAQHFGGQSQVSGLVRARNILYVSNVTFVYSQRINTFGLFDIANLSIWYPESKNTNINF